MLLNYAASVRLSAVQLILQRRGYEYLNASRADRVIRLHCRGPGSGTHDEATELKQFAYMKLLDSNCARKEY
jgi:hypothetical protein